MGGGLSATPLYARLDLGVQMKNKIIFEGITQEFDFPDGKEKDADTIKSFFKDNTEQLNSEKLNKYYLNENLSLLLGSGTSVEIGGQTINNDTKPFDKVVESLKSKPKSDYIDKIIEILSSEDYLEKKFDKINQYALYKSNIDGDSEKAKFIKEILDTLLKEFVVSYIPFPKDYIKDKLEVHELFLKKILSRPEKLNRPQLFTPNYDLAFENACEKLGISYNNGFRGTHIRKFDPDTFLNETYIRSNTNKGNKVGNYLNIYKLHGSISWRTNNNIEDLYGIVELQLDDLFEKTMFDSSSLMIYPLQAKKSYSLDLPYSELFRSFAKSLIENQNTLVIMGYSFLDEHINDIIKSGLYNPNLTIIIHSYELINEKSPSFLQGLKNRAFSDHRIQIYEGNLFGNFDCIVRYLIPLNSNIQSKNIILETLKELARK